MMADSRSVGPSPTSNTLVARLVAVVALAILGWGVTAGGLVTAAGAQEYVPPVDAPVADTFRPPSHIGGAGNRGWEYATTPGTPVVAAAAGRVTFAGTIAGQRYVSVLHHSGVKTTYSYLESIWVSAEAEVVQGQVLGTSGSVFHFGARRNGNYIDPLLLFVPPLATDVHLVPISSDPLLAQGLDRAWAADVVGQPGQLGGGLACTPEGPVPDLAPRVSGC